MADQSKVLLLFLTLLIIFVWSAINPRDTLTWALEVFPVVIGILILVSTYHLFKFTAFAYLMIWMHSIILLIGGHYTYSEMPIFNWIRDVFELSRNNYDKVGHLAQGFFPAIIAREMLLRKSPLKRGGWLFFIVVSICLAISAFYELIEWWVALLTGIAAEAFLATQGDIWDTQSDMALALIGAIASLLLLGRVHDRFLDRMEAKETLDYNRIFSKR
ncbi:MAG TPA: DUF2238 domain-containing protein [Nitrospiria bacterium]|nr:DUF2238 domain-containing protein [Nitrospiria bacterium]